MGKQIKICGIGEMLWDIQDGLKTFGGAPANFAIHCAKLGASSTIISAVGDDDLGKESLLFLRQHGVNTNGIFVDQTSQTGTVNVQLNKQGIPEYEIKKDVAWDKIPYDPTIQIDFNDLNAICFGSLAQRNPFSQRTIKQYIKDTSHDCLKVYDINLRQNYYTKNGIIQSLELANVLKINDEELLVLKKMFGLTGDIQKQVRQLIKQFDFCLAILTCGASGAYMFSGENTSYEQTTSGIKVVSTVGAGDAFTAKAIIEFLKNKPLGQINKKANEVAAYVCTQQGAVPELPEYLKI